MDIEQTEADLQGEKPILNIVGEKVALGPIQKSMLPLFMRWENDFAVTLMSGDHVRPVSREELEADFARTAKEENPRSIEFAIYEQVSMRLIGTTNWRHIDTVRRTAEYGIMIGEKDCWGKG